MVKTYRFSEHDDSEVVDTYRFSRQPGHWLIRDQDNQIIGWWVVDQPGQSTAVFNAATNQRVGRARTKPQAARVLTASN